ncbi:hypothetical protein E2P86_06460 [Sphingobacterium psychroaquaticum]|uniref:hypothetical protein n=1 Tax=Sphingobacterium psychroaquaticum TaxID=561061 RepID=UPI00106A9761|nr:hypothetical protein [Sphingobacterium psychroaquaticum]QBQ40811.1 hypothetical protein E2P86_06460 [Sphingobacterium psychroaquaticum]
MEKRTRKAIHSIDVVIAMTMQQAPRDSDSDRPDPEREERPDHTRDKDPVEQAPLPSPDMYPPEQSTPEIEGLDENVPEEHPETDIPLETPVPDIDEIDPDPDREIEGGL